ncbi:uncharacterized protein RHOBADRAFT_42507 [Rhodotorula graminis WP1]|uniref:Polynucleotide kinase 3'-phosphatase n=1 Tax=Rhodotorula graminis (strain WP1) TaxID=578459 RepID=A0A194S6K6_RHOGW|nr:uncharacterized protein RHOBADRAFT_42507 [Rhodotorula graminis WP1]KPV76179.1 hypothetical protein RHOBADRAFT_42507 [Rhodotorula graminis WP1]
MGQPSPKRRRLSPADIDLTDDGPQPATRPKPPVDQPDTGQTKLAPLFRPPAPSQGAWFANLGSGKGCGHFVSRSPAPSTKIAAFDIDGTLIRPHGNSKYPKSDSDWEWISPHVVPKLRKLHADGFAIVLFTNQALTDTRLNWFKRKIPAVARALDVPLRVFAAFDHNEFRKPAPAMWLAFETKFNGGLSIGALKDHSDTDHKFALNCGLPFMTPEQFFLDKPAHAPVEFGGWDPRTHDHSSPLYSPCSPPLLPRRRSEFDDEPPPEVVIFVGPPGVGKTTFFKTHFAPKGYVHVNQDTLKTRQACLAAVRRALTASPPKSVVVDNTSPSASVRAEYVDLVRSLNVPGAGGAVPVPVPVRVRCVYFTAPLELAMHNSVYRALHEPEDASGSGRRREVLPLAAFLGYKSRLEVPRLDEGFDDLKHVHFKFSGSPDQLARWHQWLGDVYGYKPPAKGHKVVAAAAAAAAGGTKRGRK